MEKLVLQGKQRLTGSLRVGGSKNTAIALMPAMLLNEGVNTITNVPHVRDVRTLKQIMEYTGAGVSYTPETHTVTVDSSTYAHAEAPYELVKKMRASFYMLGALLSRSGKARVSLPGGCAWGPRPVDLHLEGLKAFGASIDLEEGYVLASAPGGRLPGGSFTMQPSSVGATINLLLAAVRARGSSRIENAAREPDVEVFGKALLAMGAKIDGLGTSTLEIEGVDQLLPVTFNNCTDRIELGTFMIAAVLAGQPGSTVRITHAESDYLGDAFKRAFDQTGAVVHYGADTVDVTIPESIRPVDIETAIYPGFPTDLQAQWTVLLSQAQGPSTVTETIYTDRFKHIPELQRMGLKARVEGPRVHIDGPIQLKAAKVMSSDLRASVSLVLAGLVASGTTEVLRVYHLDRGYEDLEGKFKEAGIHIDRVYYDEFAPPDSP